MATIQPYSALIIDGTTVERKQQRQQQNVTVQQTSTPQAQHKEPRCSQCTQTDDAATDDDDDDDDTCLVDSEMPLHSSIDETIASPSEAPSTSTPGIIDQTSTELCAEIQKLNRFRKKIEQCARADVKLLASNATDARRLQFYKDRLELLENKVLVYESSGDAQARCLAERLQRECRLDACVKQLTERVERLVQTNRQLEEEKCEFEEAENDARHLLQKLEMELEMFRQRNAELEMQGERARAHANCLEDTVANAHERIQILEEHKSDLKEKLDMLTSFLPSILLCAEWKDPMDTGKRSAGATAMDTDAGPIELPASVCQCIHNQVNSTGGITPRYHHSAQQSAEIAELHRLMDRERVLKQNIEQLNRVYSETLENADIVWNQLEADYKQQLAEAHEECQLLKAKIYQLEDRLQNDAVCASERIAQLEEAECQQQRHLTKCAREQRQHAEQLLAMQAEHEALAEKYGNLKTYINGPMASSLEKERRKLAAVQEELRSALAVQQETAETHREVVAQLRSQISRTKNELLYINVSNGELKEEVDTLEHRLLELEATRRHDEETIGALSYELRCRGRTGDQLGGGGGAEVVTDCSSSSYDGQQLDSDGYDGAAGAGETLAQELAQQHAACGSFGQRWQPRNGGTANNDDEGSLVRRQLVSVNADDDEFGDVEINDNNSNHRNGGNIGNYMSRTEL